MRLFLTYVWLCCGALMGAAQPVLGPMHRLAAAEGLSQSSVAFMFRDSRGFMWLSSVDGLNRFDGRAVKVYRPDEKTANTMRDGNVQSEFFEDKPTGDIWFSTWEAIHCYRRKTDDFRYFNIKTNPQKPIGGYHLVYFESPRKMLVHIEDLTAERGGRLFWYDAVAQVSKEVGNIGGLRLLYDTTSNTTFSWHITEKEGLEVLTSDLETERYRTYFDGNDGLGFPSLRVCDLLPEGQGVYWLATNIGLVRFDIQKPAYQIFTPKDWGGRGSFFSVVAPDSRYLITSTRGSGLYVFDRKTSVFVRHIMPDKTQPNGLAGDRVDDLYLAPDSTLWLSQWTFGVQYVNLQKGKISQIRLPIPSETSYFFQGFAIDGSQNIWVATDHAGLFTMLHDGSHIRRVAFPEKTITRLGSDREGRIWVVCKHALYRQKTGTEQFVKVFTPPDDVAMRCMMQRRNGDILVGTPNGVFRLEPQTDSRYLGKPFNLTAAEHLFETSKGSLFLDNDIAGSTMHITGDDMQQYPFGSAADFYEDTLSNTLWFATSKGLAYIKQGSTTTTGVLDEHDGLPNRYLYAVKGDPNGNLWLAGIGGIVQFNLKSKKFRQFTTYDGVWEREFIPDAHLLLPDGRMFFGNRNVINVVRPDNIAVRTDVPKVCFTGVRINDQTYFDPLLQGERPELVLPHSQSTVTISFALPDFADPKQTQFRYFMEGYDRDTAVVGIGADGMARYARLHAGTYTFKVWGANADGVWTTEPHIMRLRILPPWYQTWWFKLLAAAAVAAVVWWLIRLRTERLLAMQRAELEKQQALEKERTRIARDMHDDLASGLSAINLLSHYAKNKSSDPDLQADMHMLTESSAQLNQNIREIIWTTSADDDTLASLLYFIRRYCHDFQELTKNQLRLIAPEQVPDRQLSGEVRRNIFLCLKEALNNAAKYAEGTPIEVEINLTGGHVAITVRDKGPGFDVEQAIRRAGNGLRNMQNRTANIGGKADFKSRPGLTEARFYLP